MIRFVLAVLAALALAGPAGADGWERCPGSTATSNTSDIRLNGGSDPRCHRFDSAVDPGRVNAADCRWLNVRVVSNVDNPTADYDVDVVIYDCPNAIDSGSSGCTQMALDTSGNGGSDGHSLTGEVAANRYAAYLGPGYYYFDVTGTPAETGEIRLTCAR